MDSNDARSDRQRVPRAEYELVLRPLPHVDDSEGIRRLRSILKRLLRSYRYECLRCEPHKAEAQS